MFEKQRINNTFVLVLFTYLKIIGRIQLETTEKIQVTNRVNSQQSWQKKLSLGLWALMLHFAPPFQLKMTDAITFFLGSIF